MTTREVALLGGAGLVGSRLLDVWRAEFELTAPTHAQLDVLDDHALDAFLTHMQAQVVVNLVAWADVDGAEAQKDDSEGLAYRLNVTYPRRLARLCTKHRKYLVHISTDYVFDGTNAARPYTEQDGVGPLCWYAQTKLDGERAVLEGDGNACIARIEMPFTARKHPKRDLARTIIDRLQHGRTLQGVADQRITPLFLDDAAAALARLVETRYSGVIHIAASDWTTPFAFARSIAERLDLPTELIQPETFERFVTTRPARRPQHSWLDVSHFTREYGAAILRPVEEELDSWAKQWQSK